MQQSLIGQFINQGNGLVGIKTETYQSTPGIKDDPLCSWSCYEKKWSHHCIRIV